MTIRPENRLPRSTGARQLTIKVDDQAVKAFAGESVAAVLLAQGCRTFRHTDKEHSPRGLFCGMGICFDCLVTVDGIENVRACMTQVQNGMVIETSRWPHA